MIGHSKYLPYSFAHGMRTLPFLALALVAACSNQARNLAASAPHEMASAYAQRTACIGPSWSGPPDSRITETNQQGWTAWRENLERCHAIFTGASDRLLPAYAPYSQRETFERAKTVFDPYGRGEITTGDMNARSTAITAHYAVVYRDLWRARLLQLGADAQTEAQNNADARAAAGIALGVVGVALGAAALAAPAAPPPPTLIILH